MEENLKIPNHVAIILDGNGRWAKAKGMPRNYGHVQGAKTVEVICEEAYRMGIQYLTVYAFSTENWNRPQDEVDALMKLLRNYMKTCLKTAEKNRMCVRVLGDKTRLDEDIRTRIAELEEATKNNDGLHFQIAINYGGRDEIVRAVKKLSAKVQSGEVDPAGITADTLEGYLDTVGIPDPDLLIRTCNEQRISNFLLWQLAYTEFYFTPVPWPDFTKEELIKAVEAYNHRDRRYGGLKEEYLMFWTRLLSGIVLLAIALATFSFGNVFLAVPLWLISLIAYRELTKALKCATDEKKFNALEWIGFVGVTAYYATLFFTRDHTLLLMCIVALFMAEMFCYVAAFPKYQASQVMAAVFSFLYAPVLLSFVYLTRECETGIYLVWLILISSWGCDTCAYVVGKLIGKKHIFPELSPHKSLEGCIGGVAGAALIGGLYAHFFVEAAFPDQIITWTIAFICAAGAVMSMVGDLAASAIKRNHNIKDYGKLIPGHGGIMDRFDSMTVTAPMTYFLAILMIGLR